MSKLLPLVMVMVLGGALFSYVRGVPALANSDEEISRLVETASTPEDHMNLANYYERQAMKMEQRAKSHKKLAQIYAKRSKPTHMDKHCNSLSAKYTEAAAEYRLLAEAHKQMAHGERQH